VQSYRVLKNKWVGRPMENPRVKIMDENAGGGLVVSWNGATEVKYWSVEISNDPEGEEWTQISKTDKNGFETTLPLERVAGYLRVTGLDEDKRVLGWSDVIDLSVEETWETARVRLIGESAVPFVLLIGVTAFVFTCLISWELVQWRKRVRKTGPSEESGNVGEGEKLLSKKGLSSEEGSTTTNDYDEEQTLLDQGQPQTPVPKILVERNWDSS